MSKLLLIFGLLLASGVTVSRPLNASPNCPTTAICPEDGSSGNPTGQYKWQGAVEYAQFVHNMSNGGKHAWWEKCN
jgi:hypothetical protein